MLDSSLHTPQMHGLVDRIQAGDDSARNDLLRHVCLRLERLARKMLNHYPGVRPWADTEDVLQQALLRLLRALETERPESMRRFYGLAAAQMRRELIDLTRRLYGPRGAGAHEVRRHEDTPPEREGCPIELPAADPDADLDRWSAFHEAVEALPATEREVVGLLFYHGCKRIEVAELLAVSERQVRRHWRAASRKLYQTLAGDLPPLSD